MPAKAGIQNYLKTLDSRLRGNDAKKRFKTFYETIIVNMMKTTDRAFMAGRINPLSGIPIGDVLS
jgi:hypothetical protein